MDKLFEGISKVFSHLARDIQTYIFAGFIVLANVYVIDDTYYSGDISYRILHADYTILIIIVASFIVGHICLGFYAFILEFWRFDKVLYNMFFARRFKGVKDATDESIIQDKGAIFKTDKDLYFHFIERDVNLATLRWNYSSAFFICAIIDFTHMIFMNFNKTIFLIGILSAFCSWLMMLLHIFTQKENVDQIMKLK